MFSDDLEAPGPTVISLATLETVASWYPELTLEDVRRRFRANLEIDGVPAFWEDQLYTNTSEEVIRFRLGEVELCGANPCQRCVVPTRNPEGGERYPEFTRIFTKRREQSLPPWASRQRFDHYYRLSVNTRPGSIPPGVVLKVGATVEIMGREQATRQISVS